MTTQVNTEVTLVNISNLKPHPKNAKKHSKEKLDQLTKLIEHQGFRVPVIVSNLSGKLVAGHGRVQVAKKMGITQIPVIFQDFEDEAQEYAFLISDNAINTWDYLDLSQINLDIIGFGPELDLNMLSLKDFTLDMADKAEDEPKKKTITFIECPNCLQEFEQKQSKSRKV